MCLPNIKIINNFDCVLEILFLMVSLEEIWLIFIVLGAYAWPSWRFIVQYLLSRFCPFLSVSLTRFSAIGETGNRGDRAKMMVNGHTSVARVPLLFWRHDPGCAGLLVTKTWT